MNCWWIIIAIIIIFLIFTFTNKPKPSTVEGYDYYYYDDDDRAYPMIFNMGTRYYPSYDLRGDVPLFL